MRIIKIDGDMDAASMGELKPLFEELAACVEDVRIDMRTSPSSIHRASAALCFCSSG